MKVYDELLTTIDNIPDKEIEIRWHRACPIIASLNDIHRDLLFALILHYAEVEMKFSEKGKSKIPFGGKTFSIGKGVSFMVENIPIKLQKIILEYVNRLSSN